MEAHRAPRLGFEPRDGIEVEAFGGITVYEPRGRYQLVVRELRPAGLGALLLALEELKRRLAAEGLFDAARKRPLPRYPRRIGLVTSPIGAAVRDLVKVLRARWPAIGIVLAPVRVQGEGAARGDRRRDRALQPLRRRRRADRRARRRLARGPVGVQRGDRGARDRRARACR